MIYQLVDVWILDCSGFHAGFLAIAHPRSFMALAPFARNPRGFLFLIPPATRVFLLLFFLFLWRLVPTNFNMGTGHMCADFITVTFDLALSGMMGLITIAVYTSAQPQSLQIIV